MENTTYYNVELFKKFDKKRISFNWNKKPITMDLFMSFFDDIYFEISRNHLGVDNGWTKRFNNSLLLFVNGGIINGVNYLDSIEYGEKLANPYNNYVNPFFLFDIMNEKGKSFFIDYYNDDIEKLINESKESIRYSEIKINKEKTNIQDLQGLKKLKTINFEWKTKTI